MNIFVSHHQHDWAIQNDILKTLRAMNEVKAYPVDLFGTLGPKGVFDSDKLYEKLDYPDLAVVILSSHYFDDPWFYHELPALVAIESRLNVNILLPVLLDGLEDDRIPRYLLDKNPVDFRGKSLEEGLSRLRERISRAHERELEKIFIIHGRDDLAKEALARFIERMGLEVIILHEQANKGQALIEKLEHHTDAGFALALLTPDDVGAPSDQADNLQPRARQNVIFELGLLMGRLGRHRVCTLLKGTVERPSDYEGMVYIRMDSEGAWRAKVVKELKAAGFPIDANDVLPLA